MCVRGRARARPGWQGCIHYWFTLRRVTGTRSSRGGSSTETIVSDPQISALGLSGCLLMTFSLLFFPFFLWCNFIQGWKGLFSVLWHPESFSLCSLGEAANALDDTQKSLALHLIVWQVHFMLQSHPESMYAEGEKNNNKCQIQGCAHVALIARLCPACQAGMLKRQFVEKFKFHPFTPGAAFHPTFRHKDKWYSFKWQMHKC